MGAITNFDDLTHRVESATAMFQKGIYHLFTLKKHAYVDIYSQVTRTYQCLFQICLTQLLLDSNFSLNAKAKQISRRLKRLCSNPEQPSRKELDPACIITHSIFENQIWKGFPTKHPLHLVAKHALDLYSKIVDARHNLLYRPFLLDGLFWEDCTLLDLIGTIPSIDDIEKIYRDLINALWTWRLVEQGSGLRISEYFIQTLFVVYKDRHNKRPNETLLITYARMLNPDAQQTLDELREYRNGLLDIKNPRFSTILFLPEWRFGEL